MPSPYGAREAGLLVEEILAYYKFDWSQIPEYNAEHKRLHPNPEFNMFSIDTVNKTVTVWCPSNIFRKSMSTFRRVDLKLQTNIYFRTSEYLDSYITDSGTSGTNKDDEKVWFKLEDFLRICKSYFSLDDLGLKSHIKEFQSQDKLEKEFSLRIDDSSFDSIFESRPKLKTPPCYQFLSSKILTSILAIIDLVQSEGNEQVFLARSQLFLSWLYENNISNYYNSLVIAKTCDEFRFHLNLVKADATSRKELYTKVFASFLTLIFSCGPILLSRLSK